MYTEKEVKNFLNRELKNYIVTELEYVYFIKYNNYYKQSFSVKYEWFLPEHIEQLIEYVTKSKYKSIIKYKRTVNGSHGVPGVVFNVKYKLIERNVK